MMLNEKKKSVGKSIKIANPSIRNITFEGDGGTVWDRKGSARLVRSKKEASQYSKESFIKQNSRPHSSFQYHQGAQLYFSNLPTEENNCISNHHEGKGNTGNVKQCSINNNKGGDENDVMSESKGRCRSMMSSYSETQHFKSFTPRISPRSILNHTPFSSKKSSKKPPTNAQKHGKGIEIGVNKIHEFTTSLGSIEKIKEKVKSGDFLTIREIFPNNIDSNERKIKLQFPDDNHLSLGTIQREIKAIEEQIDESPGEQDSNQKHSFQVEKLRLRKNRLLYYRKIILLALEGWKEYKSARDEFLRNRKEEGGASSIDEIEIKRFDDEYRRWKRRISERTLSRKEKLSIIRLKAHEIADDIVEKWSGKNGKSLGDDLQGEKQKIAEEIQRWQFRMTTPNSTIPPNDKLYPSKQISIQKYLEKQIEEMENKEHEEISQNNEDDVIILNDFLFTSDEENNSGMDVECGFFLTSDRFENEFHISDESDTNDENISKEKDGSFIFSMNQLNSQKSTCSRYSKRIDEDEINICNTKKEKNEIESQEISPEQNNLLRNNQEVKHASISGVNINENHLIHPEKIFNEVENLELNPSVNNTAQDDTPIIDWTKEVDFEQKMGNSLVMLGSDDDDDDDTPPEMIEKSKIHSGNLHFDENKKKIQVDHLLEGLRSQIEHSNAEKNIISSTIRDENFERDIYEKSHCQMALRSNTPRLPNDDYISPFEDANTQNQEMIPSENTYSETESALGNKLVIELSHLLGVGGHSKVYKAINKIDGSQVAVKKIPIKNGKTSKKYVKLELDILKQLSHPNLVKYLGCKYSAKQKEYSIVIEYVDSSLENEIKMKKKLPEVEVSKITKQLLMGLSYLHSKKIIHRDVKPANILISSNNQVKITDFGVSTQLLNLESMRKSYVGTPYYSAPEVGDPDSGGYSFQADIWSVGCSVYEMIEGHRPYHNLNQFNALYRMCKDDHPPIPANCSIECQDFLKKCWVKKWRDRPNALELLNHPFISANFM